MTRDGFLLLSYLYGQVSFVDRSSRLSIEKIKAADRIQVTTKIDHSCHNWIFSQKKLPIKSSLFPTAVASSQPPCITP